ncbi:UDP-glucuronosyl/UDP-glucosyltransferase [Cinara cedri]|uniref:UDP-glucuronosyltransferase n=1 Tax=Cinara cedri TaxID=506608 RepID=A0A5E4NK57_9HEMI|nr:UDP-glucuronosyl/UDP-glucosyltransferase [Cinara cedri]
MASSPAVVRLFLVLVVACIVHGPCVTNGLRVLAIEYIAGKSHWNFMSSVLRVLTDSGHHVTAFTPFLDGERANYTEVDISGDIPIKLALNATEAITQFAGTSSMIATIGTISRQACKAVHGKPQMVEILERGGTAGFDVVIAEIAGSECVSYVAAMLGVPLIYVIPSPMITYVERTVTGHVSNPATVSHMLAHHAVPGTFFQRFSNLLQTVYVGFIVHRDEMLAAIFDPQPHDLVKPLKCSLVFINSYYLTDLSRPMSSNVIQVGGLHLKSPKSIPQNILDFIEDSPNGVIYFTFGSVILMSTLPDHIQNAFIEVLAQVPQRVLWKYEGEMKNLPKNVMISKWFPQRDILLHPKIKLFISHGGISGMHEAADAGVPVLGFPLFYDQHRNVENLVYAGMAISMDLFSVQKDTLLKNILELVNNEKYMNNAKIASERFKDRPMSSKQTVIYWTEYVVRHKGAPHLKSHAFNLTWYQYFLLDVIVTMLILIAVTLFVVYKFCTFIGHLLVSKNVQKFKSKSE